MVDNYIDRPVRVRIVAEAMKLRDRAIHVRRLAAGIEHEAAQKSLLETADQLDNAAQSLEAQVLGT